MDLTNFSKVHPSLDDEITVECGARWKDVLRATLQADRTPPVLPDYMGLSVGGLLSAGGLGGQANDSGIMIDNIKRLKVMKMNGEVIDCSASENSEIFYASLGTLGQLSIILEATIKLDLAPKTCQCHSLYYDNLKSFLVDQAYLAKNKSCQYLEGQIVKTGVNPIMDSFASTGAKNDWYFMIEAVIYQDKKPLNLEKLHPISTQKEEKSYSDFIHRMKPGVKFLKANKSWHQQHPWINLLLPDKNAFTLIDDLMESLTLEDTGGWPILMYPLDKSKLSCPYFQVPEGDMIWVFSLLRHAQDAQTGERMIEKNRLLYKKAVENGGTMYPIGSIPLSHADWKTHFGYKSSADKWASFKNLKKEHDPLFLLGQGQGIFKQAVNKL